MGAVKGFIWGASIGAGLLYAFDPESGQRRRDQVKDQVNRTREKLMGLRDLPQQLAKSSVTDAGSISTRALIGYAGGLLSLYGFRPRGISNLPLGLLGLALVYKAITDESLLGESAGEDVAESAEADAVEMSREASQVNS